MRDLKKQKDLMPILLTDKTRLCEIYKLRVLAWEYTRYSNYINRQLLPEGWTDHLDKDGFHWIIENENKNIIGSVRYNILQDLQDLTQKEFFLKFQYPSFRPFGLLSRLVVHPEYRNNKLSYSLAQTLIEFIKKEEIKFSVVGVSEHGVERLIHLGFKEVGRTYYNIFSDDRPEEAFVSLIYCNNNH